MDDVFALVSLDIKCEVKEDSKNTGKVVETDTSKDDQSDKKISEEPKERLLTFRMFLSP